MITLIYIDYIDYIPPCWDSPQCLHLEEKHRICHAHNVGANLTKLHKLSPNSHLRSRSRRCKRRHNLLPASRCPWNRKPSGKWAQSMKRFEKVCKGQSMKSTVLESFNIFYFYFFCVYICLQVRKSKSLQKFFRCQGSMFNCSEL